VPEITLVMELGGKHHSLGHGRQNMTETGRRGEWRFFTKIERQ
jgi:hypothetical protein